IEDGGAEVDEAHRRVDLARRDPGAADDERDVGQLLIERAGVRGPAVLTEGLAVVGGDDDRGARAQPEALDGPQDLADLAVDDAQLAGVALEGRAAGAGAIVGQMRIVEVRVEERRPRADLAETRDERIGERL